MHYQTLLLVLLAVFSFHVHGQSLKDIEGSIPLRYERGVATDLVYEGRVLFPEEADQLHKKGIDLSVLDPKPTDVWKSQVISQSDDLSIQQNGEQLEYVGVKGTLIGYMRFTVKKVNANGTPEFFTVMIGRKVHNALLRKALLRKMGYVIPPISYLSDFQLNFNTDSARNDFVNIRMNDQLENSPTRWVKNIEEKVVENEDQPGDIQWDITKETQACRCLHFQDAIIYPADDSIYNFAIGYVAEANMRERRVFESLLVPMGLTYVDESVNTFDWALGKILNDRLFLNYEYGGQFFPKYHDAKWAARKILKLSREDWEEIVQQGHYPKAVSVILTEKLLSRRNDLVKLFSLQKEFKEISVNPEVSYSESGEEQLKNGKLVKLEWPAYASKFGYGDPESPLSSSELFAFFKSKFISNALQNLVSHINTEWMPRTNMEKAVFEKQYELALDQLVESFKAGKPVDVPFGIWTNSLYGVNIIASREIVAGRILGTENVVQLAHTIGFSAQAGVYFGTHGLPKGLSISGRAQGYVTRTYSHLQPIKSMKRALEEPYKNILIPFVAGEMVESLQRIANGEFDNLEEKNPIERKELEDELVALVDTFTQTFEEGESLIISDHLGGIGEVSAGYSLAERIRAQARLRADLKLISRLHIFRKDENTLQIYDDIGNVLNIGLSLGLDVSGTQVVGIEVFGNELGSAKTEFFSLNIDTGRDDSGKMLNSKLVENLKIVSSLFKNFNKEALKSKREPTVFRHDFSQFGLGVQLLMLNGRHLSTTNQIEVSYDGAKGDFVRYTEGGRQGVNWEALVIEVGNSVIDELIEDNEVSVSSTNSGDPGDTFYGESLARQVTFEGRVSSRVTEPFAGIEYRWKGWEASPRKVRQIIDVINNKYGRLDPNVETEHQLSLPIVDWRSLRDMESLQLYSIYLNLYIYERGLQYMASLTDGQINAIVDKYAVFPEVRIQNRDEIEHRQYRKNQALRERLTRAKRNFVDAVEEGKGKLAAKNAVRMVNVAELILPIEGLLELFGGAENIYIHSTINGFRRGDEKGDATYIANSVGELGSRKVSGPLSYVRENLGVTEGEMFISWILERL